MFDLTDRREFEADRIYQAIFNKPIREPLLTRFVEASQFGLPATDDELAGIYEAALEKNLDLEALEIAGRYTRKMQSLSTKFRLMIYLAETLPDHQQYYVNSQSGWLNGITAILIGGIRTSFKLIKGIYLLRKYRNV